MRAQALPLAAAVQAHIGDATPVIDVPPLPTLAPEVRAKMELDYAVADRREFSIWPEVRPLPHRPNDPEVRELCAYIDELHRRAAVKNKKIVELAAKVARLEWALKEKP